MLQQAVDIVIAMINCKQIGCNNDTQANIDDVKKAIDEIYKKLIETKHQ